MQRITILCLFVCLPLTACTEGIIQRSEFTPAVSVVPEPTLVPVSTPQPSPAAPNSATEPSSPVSTSILTPIPSPTLALTPPFLPTLTTTSTPAPTTTEETNTGPIIRYFRTNVEEADRGDTIVLQWESMGATKAVLWRIPSSGLWPQSGWKVDTTGVYTYEIGSDEHNWIDFTLYVLDELEHYANASLRVNLRCSISWFFPFTEGHVCPTEPVISDAAEQHFEHGTMIWIREPWAERVDGEGWIFVLYDDRNEWSVCQDCWDEDEPDRDPTLIPPAGLYQPIRGFGFLWRQNHEIRERLGWAVDQEAGFSTILQHTTRFKYDSIYLRALDGNVWHLGAERSSWGKILIEQ
jgi:hypothetical protein